MGGHRLGVAGIVAVLLLGASCARPAPAVAVAGVLDLRGWDGAAPLELSGDWAFYWHRLVDGAADVGAPDGYISMAKWKPQHLANGDQPSGRGYGTYRLLVDLPEQLVADHASLALEVATATSAQRVSVYDGGGRLLGRFDSGRVGTDGSTTVPLLVPGIITITATETIIITSQTSNFIFGSGGAQRPIVIGRTSAIEAHDSAARSLDFFIAGILFFIGLHHLIMFALRRDEKGPFWLGLFCLMMSLRPLVLGHYLERAWPNPRLFGPMFRIEYLTFYVSVPIFARFMRTLFPRHTDRPFPRAIVIAFVPPIAMVLFTSPAIFAQTVTYAQVVTVIGVIWAVYVLAKVTRLDRDVIALLMLLGVAALGVAIIHDFLVVKAYIITPRYWAQYGAAALLMFQSVLLAVMNQRARRRVEANAREIDALNATLRRQIVDRSTQLQEALMLIGGEHGAGELQAGQRLAAYRIERRLGSGGMGVVYEAVRESDARRVALKVIRRGVQPAAMARFAREAKVVAGLSHPNVVAILDVGIDEGELFLAMELITGGSLEDRRASFGRTDWALPLLHQFAGALAAIHHGGVLHRDLKPANLLIDGEVLKVADFGIASVRTLPSVRSATAVALDETRAADPTLTQDGMWIGSPMYMAPELAGGAERASVHSDVFSFGVVAFELLTGRRPFARPPVVDEHEGRKPAPPPPLVEVVPTVDPQIAALLDRCLRTDPRDRPRSDQLQAALEHA